MKSVEMLNNFTFFDYVLTFFIISILGWIVESTYCSIPKGKFVNRGFLTGPLCPIYGSGALVFMILLTRFYNRWYVVLILGIIFADTVEYITSFLMEKLFHARWWDYSKEFLNIKGRICLKHSCYWGIAALCYIYLIQPFYLKIYLSIPSKVRYIVLAVIFAVFILDLINAVKNAADVKKLKDKLLRFSENVTVLRDRIKEKSPKISEKFGTEFVDAFYKLNVQMEELKANIDTKTSRESKRKEKNRMYSAYDYLSKSSEHTINYAKEILTELKKRISDEDEEMF